MAYETKRYLTFEAWKALVNMYLKALCGMEMDDLPDYDYADAYHAGRTAGSAARAALKAAQDF